MLRLFSLLLLLSTAVHAQENPVVTYLARLSGADLRNNAGTPLTTAAAVPSNPAGTGRKKIVENA